MLITPLLALTPLLLLPILRAVILGNIEIITLLAHVFHVLLVTLARLQMRVHASHAQLVCLVPLLVCHIVIHVQLDGSLRAMLPHSVIIVPSTHTQIPPAALFVKFVRMALQLPQLALHHVLYQMSPQPMILAVRWVNITLLVPQ